MQAARARACVCGGGADELGLQTASKLGGVPSISTMVILLKMGIWGSDSGQSQNYKLKKAGDALLLKKKKKHCHDQSQTKN